MTVTSDALVSFERPPVVEAVLGIEFAPIAELGAINMCRFHGEIASEYPETTEQFAVGADFPVLFTPGVTVQSPALRLWMISADSSFLLQLQFDRLILNWRRTDSQVDYPRFPAMLERYLDAWQRFVDLSQRLNIGPVIPRLAEMTYVNSVAFDQQSLSVAALGIIQSERQPELTNFALNWVYPVPEFGSNLGGHVNLMANKVPDNGGNELSLNVTARLRFDEIADLATVDATIKDAHRVAVQSFAENTSEQQHLRWGIRG